VSGVWKLMIADDEPKIRRGLRSQIEHMALDIEIVAEADDGERALEEALATQPDILLVDINMPFLNGLDFVEQLKRTRGDARIIVITGFEAFEYARRALDLGVHAYLLKPVELSELRATLDGVIQELSSERERERHFAWALSQLDKRKESLREEFLSEVIRGGLTQDEISDQAALLKFPALVRASLMLIRAVPDAGQPWRPRILQFAFQDALKDVLSRCRFSCVFADERDHVMVLYDADQSMDERIVQTARQAGALLSASTAIQVAPAGGLADLEEAYNGLLEAMQREASRPAAVEQAAAFIQRNFSRSDLGLTDVADAVGVNPSYLSRLMKQELGMPFSKYLTTVRIGAAVALMQRGETKIRQIGERVGYATPHYFSTAFKKVLGASPVEYRSEDRAK
jgi:two-component system response regulator YesN